VSSLFVKPEEKPVSGGRVDKFLGAKGALIGRGRLVFALDATESRRPTWDLAARLQAEMFREATREAGALEYQLAYYRGLDECRTSAMVRDPERLLFLMQGITCRSGPTQIGRILDHTARTAEGEAMRARIAPEAIRDMNTTRFTLTFIGDAVEESSDVLVGKAGALRQLKVPAFMFQEGQDPLAERVFRDIARATGGAYARFDAGAGKRLGELLKAAAIYAAGGTQALEGRKDDASRLLIAQMKG
jgi:hypothetical protein